MMWGTYHGLLLVLHRQWQEFRNHMGFDWSGALATGISWWLTFSAVCIGYIFFRAENVRQALAMLKALASLHTYRQLTLDHSFYLMTFLAAASYFAVIGACELLDRLGKAVRGWGETAQGTAKTLLANLLGSLADERWVWITPVVIVAAVYLSVIFQPGHADTSPIMYALF